MDKHNENSEMVLLIWDVPDVPHRIYTELKNTLAGFNSWVEEAEEWISEAEEKAMKITWIEQKRCFF